MSNPGTPRVGIVWQRLYLWPLLQQMTIDEVICAYYDAQGDLQRRYDTAIARRDDPLDRAYKPVTEPQPCP